MKDIVCIDHHNVPWLDYEDAIRVKPLTREREGVPPVQYVQYAPGHTDPIHSHDTDEFFIVTDGEIWLDDVRNGPGSVVFIPKATEYAVRAGTSGASYFRIVV